MQDLVTIVISVNAEAFPTWLPESLLDEMAAEVREAATDFNDHCNTIKEKYEAIAMERAGKNVVLFPGG